MSARPSAFVYRRLASPLHAARAGVAVVWSVALAAAGIASDSPIALSLVLAAILSAGALAGLGRELARSLRLAAIVAVPIVAVNVLVSREGLTVFARLGDLGPFGQGDLTVEALVYGATIALKVTILMLATMLASLAVDPDELLRAARRLSFRSALTASLAIRMLPVLAGDGRRLAEAQRTRPRSGSTQRGERGVYLTNPPTHCDIEAPFSPRSPRSRFSSHLRFSRARALERARVLEHTRVLARARAKLVSAVVASSLDRALDVAATLELRGFAQARRPPWQRRSWSRHDVAFAASAVALIALTLGARVASLAPFQVYPEVHGGPAGAAVALGAGVALLALLPFVDRRGIEP